MGFSLGNLLKQASAEINPFDHGQTASTVARSRPVYTPPASTAQPQQYQQAPQRQQIQQQSPIQHAFSNFGHAIGNIEHAGGNAVNAFSAHSLYNTGKGAVQFVPQFAENYANTFANLANKASAVTPGGKGPGQQTIQQNMGNNRLLKNTLKFSGATGTNKQLAGDVAQIGLSTLPGVGTGASLLAKTGVGAATGAGFNAASTAGNGGTIKDTLKSAAVGAALGGALPGAGKLLAKGGTKAAVAAKDIATGKPMPSVSDSQLTAASRVSMLRNGFPDNTKPNDVQAYRQVQQKLGVDANNHEAVDGLISSRMTHDVKMQQLKQTTQNVLHPTPLGQSGKALVSEDGSVIPTIRNALGKAVESKPAKTASATPTAQLPKQPAMAAPKPSPVPKGTAAKPGDVSLGKNKTGIVDKQSSEAEQAQRQVVNYAADEIMAQNPTRNLRQEVMQQGGIGSSAYESIPKGLVRKSGMSADRVAQAMGFKSENHLMDALANEKAPLTGAQAKDLAQQQLESGQHPYSADYKQIQDALQKRQDELSLYPKGTQQQVKVTTKPPTMSSAEFQSLAGQPEAIRPKVGNKVLTPNPKTTLRNADAERQVQDVLAKGGTSEQAIGAYQAATGADLQSAVRDVRRVANESSLGFEGGKNPLTDKVPMGGHIAPRDHAQALLNADFIKQHERAIGKDALDAFHGLSEHDKTLLQAIEKDTVTNVAKRADNPQAFTNAEKSIRTYYDTRHAYDTGLGVDVGYRTNYLRQLFSKAEEEAKANMPEQVTMKAGNKRPGYTQARSYDTLNTHVGDALERDINGASANHAKLAYAQGLETAHPGLINNSGQLVRGNDGKAFRQLTNKYGEGISAHPSIAQDINKRSRTETTSKALNAYDKANAGIKYAKLGGGAFHAVTEAGNFIGQQLTSGKLFTEPQTSAKALGTFFSKKLMSSETARMGRSGLIDNAHIAGLKIMPHEILADANVKLGGKISKYTGIQTLHDATFQREIPYMKLKMFEQKIKGLDATKPADIAKMRSEAKGINSLFGGINRDIEGINPDTFKRMQRFILATDFTESKIGTALRAVNVTDRSPAANLARQAILGKVLLFGALATAGGAIGGEFKGKTGKQIAMDIAGKLADPSFKAGRYKVGLPSTHVSEFSRPLTPLFKPATKGSSKGDRFAGLQHYGTGRLAAIPSELLQLKTNRDFSGNKLYGKDYAFNGGNQISGAKTVANILSGFTPIPGSQAIGVAQGKTDPRAAIANVAGLRVTNEQKYSQNATPVKVSFGNNSTTLTGNDAIAYNKAISDQRAALGKQLQASSQYKNATPDAQKAMTAKLNGYITDNQKRIFATQKNIPLDKAASVAVQAVNSGKLPDDFSKGTTTASVSRASYYKSPAAEYNAMQTAYNTKLKSNSFNSPAAQIKAQNELAKAKVGSGYNKQVRDLYGLSKADVNTYLSTPETGVDKQAISQQLLAYDKALKDAGQSTYLKYKNGFAVATKGSGLSGGTRVARVARGGTSGTGRSRSTGTKKIALSKFNLYPGGISPKSQNAKYASMFKASTFKGAGPKTASSKYATKVATYRVPKQKARLA